MKRMGGLILAVAAVFLLTAGWARAEMVRELVRLHGAVPMRVEGIGFVTGLDNTGDKSTAALKMLHDYLISNPTGINPELANLNVGSVALVKVTGEIVPNLRPGSKFAVTVTATQDAKSIVGGQLRECVLWDGSNNQMAIVAGQVMGGSTSLNRGTIPVSEGGGAIMIGVYPFGDVMGKDNCIRFNLRYPNWNDAATIARQINQNPSLNPYLQETSMFAEAAPSRPVAYAVDSGQVLIEVPLQYRNASGLTTYISGIMDVPVSINRPATIAINRARNTIVVTGDIRVNNASVSLQDKTVTVRPETPERPAGYVLENDTPRSMVELEGPGSYADMQGLIDTLNAMGLTTDQIITIFEELLAARAIRAELLTK